MTMTRIAGIALVASAFAAAPMPSGGSGAGHHAAQFAGLEEQFYDLTVSQVGGTFATLRFKSKDPCIPFVAVGEIPLTPVFAKGSWEVSQPKHIVRSVFPLMTGPRTVHEVTVTNLRPGRDHWVAILPKGKQITKQRLPATTKLTTLHRRVHVAFEQIEMIDDSDDLSDGEFEFDFLVLSKQTVVSRKDRAVRASIGSGASKAISVILDAAFDDDEIRLGVTGVDSDGDGHPAGLIGSSSIIGLGAFRSAAKFPTAGNNSQFEWASGSTRIDLGHATQAGGGTGMAVTETFSRTFDIGVSGLSKNQLRFNVRGLLKVVYE